MSTLTYEHALWGTITKEVEPVRTGRHNTFSDGARVYLIGAFTYAVYTIGTVINGKTMYSSALKLGTNGVITNEQT